MWRRGLNIIKVVTGYYGSGKTTFCKKQKGFKHFELDNFTRYSRSLEEYLSLILHKAEHYDIIIDFYFKPSYKHLLDRIIRFCEVKNIEFEVIEMKTSLEDSYRRYLKRERSNIKDFYVSFEKYKEVCEVNDL